MKVRELYNFSRLRWSTLPTTCQLLSIFRIYILKEEEPKNVWRYASRFFSRLRTLLSSLRWLCICTITELQLWTCWEDILRALWCCRSVWDREESTISTKTWQTHISVWGFLRRRWWTTRRRWSWIHSTTRHTTTCRWLSSCSSSTHQLWWTSARRFVLTTQTRTICSCSYR